MIEYQGWVVVRESYNEEGESDELLNEIREQLSSKVSIINSSRFANICTLTLVNGNLNLLIASLDNHRSSSWDEIVDLFDWLSKCALGSYGVLYFHDDEDTFGLDNKFQVMVLKKGNISFEIDTFFLLIFQK